MNELPIVNRPSTSIADQIPLWQERSLEIGLKISRGSSVSDGEGRKDYYLCPPGTESTQFHNLPGNLPLNSAPN